MPNLGTGQNTQAVKVDSRKGALSSSILEIHNQIDMASRTLLVIEDCVFVPRPQAVCDAETRPQASTVDQKLYEIQMRLCDLNQRLREIGGVLQDQLADDLKLV